jgi:hypothetical protein
LPAAWSVPRSLDIHPHHCRAAGARPQAYYMLVLMEPRDAVLFNDFNLVAKSVKREYEVNLGLTESNTPECVADLFRQAQPFYVAADYQPPTVSASANP